jgi:sulfate adenylyltransferase
MANTGSGACVWLTGRSGAGKTTVVRALTPHLDALGRRYTVLDVVPLIDKHRWERSSEGKLLRKAFVASEIVRHGGIAICVTVSSRRSVREKARDIVGAEHFVEVYLDTPAEVAARRKQARGRPVPLIKRLRRAARQFARRIGFGEGDGFEVPRDPDVIVDGRESSSPETGALAIMAELVRRGVVAEPTAS